MNIFPIIGGVIFLLGGIYGLLLIRAGGDYREAFAELALWMAVVYTVAVPAVLIVLGIYLIAQGFGVLP